MIVHRSPHLRRVIHGCTLWLEATHSAIRPCQGEGGVRHAYTDSCSRLVGALEELEETLCSLSGEPYRQDEPILRARAHMEKNLQLLR